MINNSRKLFSLKEYQLKDNINQDKIKKTFFIFITDWSPIYNILKSSLILDRYLSILIRLLKHRSLITSIYIKTNVLTLRDSRALSATETGICWQRRFKFRTSTNLRCWLVSLWARKAWGAAIGGKAWYSGHSGSLIVIN